MTRRRLPVTLAVLAAAVPRVPAYPAAHGCMRVPRDDAPGVYAFASLNTLVTVYR